MLRHPGSSSVRCLAQASHLSCGIEDGKKACNSLPPLTIPAGPEIRTHNHWDALSIRPQLPPFVLLLVDCAGHNGNDQAASVFFNVCVVSKSHAESPPPPHWCFYGIAL